MSEKEEYYQGIENNRKEIMKKRLGGLFLVVDLLLVGYIVFQIISLIR